MTIRAGRVGDLSGDPKDLSHEFEAGSAGLEFGDGVVADLVALNLQSLQTGIFAKADNPASVICVLGARSTSRFFSCARCRAPSSSMGP